MLWARATRLCVKQDLVNWSYFFSFLASFVPFFLSSLSFRFPSLFSLSSIYSSVLSNSILPWPSSPIAHRSSRNVKRLIAGRRRHIVHSAARLSVHVTRVLIPRRWSFPRSVRVTEGNIRSPPEICCLGVALIPLW